jgi:hypothetical protein
VGHVAIGPIGSVDEITERLPRPAHDGPHTGSLEPIVLRRARSRRYAGALDNYDDTSVAEHVESVS